MKNIERFRRDIWLLVVILIGIFLRFIPGFQAGFPLNDGGMFLSMIRDLQTNHFILPYVTSYNLSGIPFAYPPLGIYIAAFISSLLKISAIDLLRWLPAIVSAFIIPVFYWLSLQIFVNRTKSLFAVTFLVFLPGSFDWLIMGGGLTRSLGILFFLLAVGCVLRLFRDSDNRFIWPSILFCSLAVLSHPEVGLQTAGICFLLWVVFGRNLAGTKNALLVILGTVIMTSPWWLTILVRHGAAPFESAVQTGVREKLLASLFNSFFSVQGGLPILPILTLLGLFMVLRRREFFLVGWAFFPFFLDPRNAPAVAIYAFILLASEGAYFLYAQLDRIDFNSFKDGSQAQRYGFYVINTIFILFVTFLVWVSFRSAWNFSRVSLSEADRKTMEWIKGNTPEYAPFLLLTNSGQVSPMVDAYQEWFPALAERHSQNTLQGLEWTIGPEFYGYSLKLMELQSCEDVACVQNWTSENNIQINYVLVRPKRVSPELVDSILLNESFHVIYQTDDVVVYEYK
jgi:hypothetical protein